MHAPAPAIARFILESGGASSSEILLRFAISETTLRRRRPAIRRYGIVFVERGSGSYYAPVEIERLPDHYRPTAVHEPAHRIHGGHVKRESPETPWTPKTGGNSVDDARERNP